MEEVERVVEEELEREEEFILTEKEVEYILCFEPELIPVLHELPMTEKAGSLFNEYLIAVKKLEEEEKRKKEQEQL